jgi:hypothetical protein
MLSCIWPDQAARVARAEAALSLAARENVEMEAIDAARFAELQLRVGAPGRALVLVHSIFWQYLAKATRAAIWSAIARAVDGATAASPFA